MTRLCRPRRMASALLWLALASNASGHVNPVLRSVIQNKTGQNHGATSAGKCTQTCNGLSHCTVVDGGNWCSYSCTGPQGKRVSCDSKCCTCQEDDFKPAPDPCPGFAPKPAPPPVPTPPAPTPPAPIPKPTPTSTPGSSCVNDDAATSDDVYKDCNIMELQNTPPGAATSTLVAAVVAGDLVDTLTSPGPFTIFAPSDKAFEELPAGVVDNLLKPENKAALVSLLNYHVLPKQVRSKDWKPTQVVKTVEGKTLHVVVDATGKTCPQQPGSKEPPFICVSVGPSLKDLKKQVATSEFLLSNAAMYLIDGVLLSPTSMPPVAEELPPAANVTVQHDCKKACDCSCWSPEYRHPNGHAGDGSCVCLKDHAPFYYKKCCSKSDILV